MRREVAPQLPEDRHCKQNGGCESAKEECRRRTETSPVSLHALMHACEVDRVATDENDRCDSPINETDEGQIIGENIGERRSSSKLRCVEKEDECRKRHKESRKEDEVRCQSV